MGTKVVWKNNIYYVTNIYSSCEMSKKKKLWKYLLDLKDSFNDGEWIMGAISMLLKLIERGKGGRYL